MAKISLKSVRLGPVANDGGMGTVLTNLINIVRDTAVLTTADGTKTDFMAEEYDTPFYSYTTQGTKSMAFDVYIDDGSELLRIFGGSYTPATTGSPASWEAPTNINPIEQSAEFTHRDGSKVEIPRLSVSATLEWNFKTNALPIIHVNATVLQPTKDGVASFKYTGKPVS